jgi:hypothetical protein
VLGNVTFTVRGIMENPRCVQPDRGKTLETLETGFWTVSRVSSGFPYPPPREGGIGGPGRGIGDIPLPVRIQAGFTPPREGVKATSG